MKTKNIKVDDVMSTSIFKSTNLWLNNFSTLYKDDHIFKLQEVMDYAKPFFPTERESTESEQVKSRRV